MSMTFLEEFYNEKITPINGIKWGDVTAKEKELWLKSISFYNYLFNKLLSPQKQIVKKKQWWQKVKLFVGMMM